MPGTTLGELAALFPRIEHSVEELRHMAADNDEPPGAPAPSSPAPASPVQGTRASGGEQGTRQPAPGDRIAIDDFMKVEMRVAKVLAAERVPKSNKLLKLQVDTGVDQRTVVAGIAESYEPETLVGRSVVIVSNLKPAKLMGIESNGMVLAASPDGGKAMLLSFDEPPVPGTRVR
jgi:methionyl-tRNA synthetase